MKQVFVLSDLHIENSKDPLYVSFLKVLCERPQSGDIVVLAGDVFDFWVGNRKFFKNEYAHFFSTLEVLRRKNVIVYYIEGNHDFHLKSALSEKLKLEHRSIEFSQAGKKFFVAHGDLVNLRDIGYLLLRFLFRSPLIRFLVQIVPESWLQSIGTTLSRKSRQFNPRIREGTRASYRNFALRKIEHGFDFVALGHCHDLDQMNFSVGARQASYANVGYPRIHKSYLCWKEGDHEFQRQPFPDF